MDESSALLASFILVEYPHEPLSCGLVQFLVPGIDGDTGRLHTAKDYPFTGGHGLLPADAWS